MLVNIKNLTICKLLSILYISAHIEKREMEKQMLREAFLMAKRMNRKLYKYKYKELPEIEGNSWREVDWIAELEGSVDFSRSEQGKEGGLNERT